MIQEIEKRDRAKELNCLYGTPGLVEKPSTSMDEVLQGIINLIPPGWQYPEITCARVSLEGQAFETSNFRDGSLFNHYLSANMVEDEEGKPVCMIASFIDKTQQKLFHNQLIRSER